MGANIVRRVPAQKPARQHERIPTARMGELQLEDLVRDHTEGEPVEPAEVANQSARDGALAPGSPGGSSPRLAHTLRRGDNARTETSTIAMPRLGRPPDHEIPRLFDRDAEDPTAVLDAPLVAALLSRATPSADRARTREPLVPPRVSALGTSPDETAAQPAMVPLRAPAGPATAASPAGDVVRRADSRPAASPASAASPAGDVVRRADSRPANGGPPATATATADSRPRAVATDTPTRAVATDTPTRAVATDTRPRAAVIAAAQDSRPHVAAALVPAATDSRPRVAVDPVTEPKRPLLRSTWPMHLILPLVLLTLLAAATLLLLRAIL
jgi:hypothetical protein